MYRSSSFFWLGCAVIGLFIASCDRRSDFHTTEPIPGVVFTINVTRVLPKSDRDSTFLYFDLAISNESGSAVTFDLAALKARFNGRDSQGVYYDSLASVMPGREQIPSGKKTYQLYLVFPGADDDTELRDFAILRSGIEREPRP